MNDTTKHTAYVEQNQYGYWCGGIEYPDGTKSLVTNAKNSKTIALEIATRMAEQITKLETDKLLARIIFAERFGRI